MCTIFCLPLLFGTLLAGNVNDASLNSTVAVDATPVSVSANSTTGPATRKLLKDNDNAPKAGAHEGPAGGKSEVHVNEMENSNKPEDAGSKGNDHAHKEVNVTRPMHGQKVKGGPRRGRDTKMAAFLMSGEKAAALNLATYAYDAVDGTARSNVTVYMRQGLDEDKLSGDNKTVVSLVTLEFPYFTSLYYDPDVEFASASDLGYANYTVAIPADTTVVVEEKPKNGVAGTSARSGTVLLGLAGVALGMLVL